MLTKHLLKQLTGILAPSVAVKQQPLLPVGTTTVPSHLKSVSDQLTAYLLLQRPAHYLTAEQVQHHGQKQPAFTGGDVGDIVHPRLVGSGGELAIQHIVSHRKAMPAVSGLDPKATLAPSRDAVLLHQLLHALLADPEALPLQLSPDPWPTISAACFCVDRESAPATPPRSGDEVAAWFVGGQSVRDSPPRPRPRPRTAPESAKDAGSGE